MNLRNESAEVLYAEPSLVNITRDDVCWLKQRASNNPRHRIRLCSHQKLTDVLHEMIIIHKKDVYVPPHKHPCKSESIHIIEGLVDIVVFDDNGIIDNVIPLGEYPSGRSFYCRMNSSVYHTLLIRSANLVFHETTNGPFQKNDTQFAPWAPKINDIKSCKKYQKNLKNFVDNFAEVENTK